MEERRPESAPAPAAAIFAAEVPEFAAYYLAKQGVAHAGIRLY